MHRRDWLRRLVAAGAAGVMPGVGASAAHGLAMGERASWLDEALPILPAEPRRLKAYDLRVKAAYAAAGARTPPQDGRVDEARVPAFLAMFSKGLPHDAYGIVDPSLSTPRVRVSAIACAPPTRIESKLMTHRARSSTVLIIELEPSAVRLLVTACQRPSAPRV